METLIVRPTPDKPDALKAFLKALKIDFEKGEAYSPEFEAKMKRADEEKKEGRYKVIKTEDLWK